MSYVIKYCKKCKLETPHWQNFVTTGTWEKTPNGCPIPHTSITLNCAECGTINHSEPIEKACMEAVKEGNSVTLDEKIKELKTKIIEES